MSDVMPKVKLYLILSFIALFINLGVILTVIATDSLAHENSDINITDVNLSNVAIDTGQDAHQNESIIQFFWRRITEIIGVASPTASLTSLGFAFIPFASIFSLATLNIEITIFSILMIGIGIISAIQGLLLLFIALQVVSNIIYHPDV